MAANAKHSDFITNCRQACKAGTAALAALAAIGQQYQLLYATGAADPLTADDFAGANADIAPADIAAAMGVFQQIGTAMGANNNAAWIAALKVGR